jgi:hypothetical protein
MATGHPRTRRAPCEPRGSPIGIHEVRPLLFCFIWKHPKWLCLLMIRIHVLFSLGQLISDASQVSNYRKRPRTSGPTTPSRSSTPGTASDKDSPESRASSSQAPITPPPRAPSRARLNRASVQASVRSARSARTDGKGEPGSPTRSVAHRASGSHLSAVSTIPVRALVTPHAPSISRSTHGSSRYHMRDPRRPQTRPTGWVPRPRRSKDDVGSPVHAWLFYAGFLFFPIWWFAALLGVPTTRTVGGSDTEKAVFVDDPQIEHGALFIFLFSNLSSL